MRQINKARRGLASSILWPDRVQGSHSIVPELASDGKWTGGQVNLRTRTLTAPIMAIENNRIRH